MWWKDISPEKVAILNWLDLHMHHCCNAMQGQYRLIVQVSIFWWYEEPNIDTVKFWVIYVLLDTEDTCYSKGQVISNEYKLTYKFCDKLLINICLSSLSIENQYLNCKWLCWVKLWKCITHWRKQISEKDLLAGNSLILHTSVLFPDQ
jgi:hypothetical protein